jgi:murein L,D-transpeptidase YcbB/YkuD
MNFFFRDGKPELVSKVVVGKAMNKTVILVPMKYIVFRPYWNVPTSILKKEILPAIEKSELLGRTQIMERQF